MAITTEKELGEALKNNQDTIEIEGDLAKKVIRIRATGKVVWAVAIGCVAVAITSIVSASATGGVSGVVACAATPVAVATLGAPTAISVVLIAISTGGVGSLSKLRQYKMKKKSCMAITLER